ncbi:uncharacterized protein [Amphiura filiformis]|uniref:uncharacterized protein n=1 Tax=Amphiura filiformis TaxID=82378 RepID=UPI003B21C862
MTGAGAPFCMLALCLLLQMTSGDGERMPVDLVMRKAWLGGFLADMEVPINETTPLWRINLDFRRQVYSFSIEGCEAEVSERVTAEQRRPKGSRRSMYVLTPSGENENATLEAGDVLRLTVVGETWKRYRPRENFIIGAELDTEEETVE